MDPELMRPISPDVHHASRHAIERTDREQRAARAHAAAMPNSRERAAREARFSYTQ